MKLNFYCAYKSYLRNLLSQWNKSSSVTTTWCKKSILIQLICFFLLPPIDDFIICNRTNKSLSKNNKIDDKCSENELKDLGCFEQKGVSKFDFVYYLLRLQQSIYYFLRWKFGNCALFKFTFVLSSADGFIKEFLRHIEDFWGEIFVKFFCELINDNSGFLTN